MTKYEHVVFLDGDEGHDVTDRLFNVVGVVAHGVTAESIAQTFDYLRQWDYGDALESSDDLGAGADDLIVFEHGNRYVLSANLGIGYVSLSRVIGGES